MLAARRNFPLPIRDQFGRITNFYVRNGQLIHGRNPEPLNAYWEKCTVAVQSPHYFHIFQYSPLEGKLADLNLAMEGAVLDCAPDVHKLILKEFAPIKLWITVLVRYEPANPLDDPERHGFDQYLSAPATRVFRREGIVNLWESPYADDLRLLTERIKIHNAKFIRDKSGLVLAEIKNLYFRACRYDPLRGSSWKPLPGFLQRKHCIVNIQNKDNRCFGYALLYFLIKKPNRNLQRSSLYTRQNIQAISP